MTRRLNGDGSIRQRKDGRWEARYPAADGRRHSIFAKTRRDAAAALRDALRDRDAGRRPADRRLTVAAYLDQWLESARPAVRPSTWHRYADLVRLHLAPTLGRISLAQLEAADVDRMLNRKLAAGLSPRTVHHLRAVLRRALNVAVRRRLVPHNAAADATPPRVPEHQVPALSPEQARALLEAVRGDRLEALYVTALATGARQGELLGLRWQDVDLDAGELRIRHALQRVDGAPVLVEPKTARSRRAIPLPGFAVRALVEHRARQREDALLAGSSWRGPKPASPTSYVFASTVGTALDGTNVTHRLRRLLAAAGLERMRFHDLRHGAATLLLAQGVSPRVIMEQLGHSQIAITMNLYAHVGAALQREAADRMEAALGG